MSNSSFDEQLRRYLENVQDEPRADAEPGFRLDVAQLRQHFLQRLRRGEQYAPDWVKHIHREWSSELEAFARYIETSGEPNVLEEALTPQAYAAKVLDAALSCIESTTPLVTRLELERVSAGFVPARIAAYCLETGLTRRELEGAPRITTLGRIFLRLRGKDVVRAVRDNGPWHAAVTALLEDQRLLVLPVSGPTATEATIEQTRLIARREQRGRCPVEERRCVLSPW